MCDIADIVDVVDVVDTVDRLWSPAVSPRFSCSVFSRFVQPVELSAAGSVSAAAGCVASRRVCCFGCRFSCLCGFGGGNWIAATHHLSSPGKETVASAAASSGVSGGIGAGLQ